MSEICHNCGLVHDDDCCECSCQNCGVRLMSNESKICSLCVAAGEHASDLGWHEELTDKELYGDVPFYNSLEEYIEVVEKGNG